MVVEFALRLIILCLSDSVLSFLFGYLDGVERCSMYI